MTVRSIGRAGVAGLLVAAGLLVGAGAAAAGEPDNTIYSTPDNTIYSVTPDNSIQGVAYPYE